jgi:hypothetical protein
MARYTFETTLILDLGTEAEWECRVTGFYEPGIPSHFFGARPESGEPASFAIDTIEVRRPPGDNAKPWHALPMWLVTDRQREAIEEEAIQNYQMLGDYHREVVAEQRAAE